MKKKIYKILLVLVLCAASPVAFGQFGNLKNKMKEKVEKLDKPSDKGSSDKKNDEENEPKPAQPVQAEEKTTPPAPAEKKESAPAKAPESAYLPNGDIKIVFSEGDNDDESAAIRASNAKTSIWDFRQALIDVYAQTKNNDKDHIDKSLQAMNESYAEIKQKDPSFDMKKYETTYNKYLKIWTDKNKAINDKAVNDKKDALDATNGVIARKIREVSPGKYLYSALISQSKKDDYFLYNRNPEYEYIVNAVNYTDGGTRRVMYYRFTENEAEFAKSLKEEDLGRHHEAKEIKVAGSDWSKIDDCFCSAASVQVGFEGIVAQKDGSILVFHAPLVKGSDKHHDFDLAKMNVDVLTKDLAAAKAADLEVKKKEGIAYINKALKKEADAAAGDKTKRIAEKRKTPVGMVSALPVATIKDELMKMLASKPVYGTNMQRNSAECSYTVTSAYVIDKDWVIERNPLGVILGRRIATEATEKGSNGKCYLRRYAFYEQNQGGDKYGAPYVEFEIFWSDTRDDGEAICDNIK